MRKTSSRPPLSLRQLKYLRGGVPVATEEAPTPEAVDETPRRRRRMVVACVACLALIGAIGGVALISQPASDNSATEVVAADDEEEEASVLETVDVSITETAPGITKDTSAVITHYTGKTGDAKGIEFYHATEAVSATKGTDTVELAEGTYEVEFLPSVNKDGSINTGSEKAVELTVKADTKAEATFEAKTIEADKVTADQIADVQDKVAEAVAKGDETLSGDAGEKVADKVAENVSQAPAADEKKVEEAKKEAAENADKSSATTTQDKSTSTSSKTSTTVTPTQASQKTNTNKQSSSTSTKTDTKKNQSSSSSSSSSKTDSKSDSKSDSKTDSKPAHTHTWVAVTHEEPVYKEEPVYETKTKTVVDQEAYDTYENYEYYLFSDGHIEYDKNSVYSYQYDHEVSFKCMEGTNVVHHDAITHEESYQEQTGTRKVQEGTKTITDCYKCSSCGATK